MSTIHAPASLPIGYVLSGFAFFLLSVIIYLYRLDQTLRRVPMAGEKLSPYRWTVEDIHAAYERAQTSPVDVREYIPPRQQRRYIVVGGSGGCMSPSVGAKILISNRTRRWLDRPTSTSSRGGS